MRYYQSGLTPTAVKFVNQNAIIFIEEYAIEDAVYKMSAILFRPQCVKAIRSVDKDAKC